LAAFNEFKKYAVVVYVNSKKGERDSLSPMAYGVLTAKSSGKYIPKAVITSSDQKTYFASIAYKSMSGDKAFRDVNKLVKQGIEGEPAPLPKDVVSAWSAKKNGMFYRGNFVELAEHKKHGKTVVLNTLEGKKLRVPIKLLSEKAQSYALAMGGGAEHATGVTQKAVEESWESAQGGKTITATFVALKGDMITLKKQNGSDVTFKLAMLSEKSQERAKELAGAE